jgi:RNA polymerase sigma factor (sigma-70 family)
MKDDSTVVALVENAAGGKESAWNTIVRRYQPLVWSICHRYGLTGADADDIGGNVWLRLVTKLSSIREPAALPGWLATTARRECLRLLRDQHRSIPYDVQDAGDPTEAEPDTQLLMAERRTALRGAFARLPERDRQLLTMLFADPPVAYTEISTSLDMPVGAIGPTRQRCLARVRRTPAVAALLKV